MILDNLSTHKCRAVRQWSRGNQSRVVLHRGLQLLGEPARTGLRASCSCSCVGEHHQHPNGHSVDPSAAGPASTLAHRLRPRFRPARLRNAANAPEPEPRKAIAGADHSHKQHETPQKRHARKRLWTPQLAADLPAVGPSATPLKPDQHDVVGRTAGITAWRTQQLSSNCRDAGLGQADGAPKPEERSP